MFNPDDVVHTATAGPYSVAIYVDDKCDCCDIESYRAVLREGDLNRDAKPLLSLNELQFSEIKELIDSSERFLLEMRKDV